MSDSDFVSVPLVTCIHSVFIPSDGDLHVI